VFRATTAVSVGPAKVSLRCPACGDNGTFQSVGTIYQLDPANVMVGMYTCPRPDCQTLLYVVTNPGGGIVATFPPELIDFDATNLPPKVQEALEEAIMCHGTGCYTASAMMVRKTLEELCADRGATGANLKERIQALGKKVVLPKELLDGIDDLRLLGNDAAHIESRDFDEIGEEEVEVGIALAKKVLEASYQYADLVAKLQALKSET
jgi:Domain of unknown function (DUF4145)